MPPVNGAFEWIRLPWGPALRCVPLAAIADHFFTGRQPVLLREGIRPGDGWHRVALSMGVAPRAVVRLQQVHGSGVVVISAGDVLPADWGTGDIVVTDDERVAPCVQVADCVPILMADRRSGAVAAAHAGWRGAASGVAGTAVAALVSAFGADPADVTVAIGPSIGPCCYRVGADVCRVFAADERWSSRIDRWLTAEPKGRAAHGVPGSDPSARDGMPGRFLDTWAANADQLQDAGIPPAHVHVSAICTSCHRDMFHSYRVDGAEAGRMIGVIRSGAKREAPAASPPRPSPGSPVRPRGY
ncbi:MAG: polyphenol oxidase family protein [Acidobacteria bacterium]|nr:polyphenol oxidase family protein [Acidobacteriota bacterium]